MKQLHTALGSRAFLLNRAVAAPSTPRGALAKDRLGVPGTACVQGPRQAASSVHRLLFEGGSKRGGTDREAALQCYEI